MVAECLNPFVSVEQWRAWRSFITCWLTTLRTLRLTILVNALRSQPIKCSDTRQVADKVGSPVGVVYPVPHHHRGHAILGLEQFAPEASTYSAQVRRPWKDHT